MAFFRLVPQAHVNRVSSKLKYIKVRCVISLHLNVRPSYHIWIKACHSSIVYSTFGTSLSARVVQVLLPFTPCLFEEQSGENVLGAMCSERCCFCSKCQKCIFATLSRTVAAWHNHLLLWKHSKHKDSVYNPLPSSPNGRVICLSLKWSYAVSWKLSKANRVAFTWAVF